MTIKVGETLPDTTFLSMGEQGPAPVQASEFFKGRKVALVGVPGAFTPTCSARHLPGFIENADALKEKGVDAVACMSVNDPFVMHAWGLAQGANSKITLLADGNAEFTKAVGLEMDGSKFGMGTRCQRFSMLVDDGVVEALYVEQPGAFEVSSAEHMLAEL